MLNIDYTLYRVSTGEILQSGWGTPPAGPETAWIEGQHDSSNCYVTADGAVAELPPRPGPWAVFDRSTGVWTDPRTPAETAAQHAAALIAARRRAELEKSDLLIRLVIAGILSPSEAEEAAAGAIPESMAAMMAALPEDAQMAARIKWRTDGLISRTHPVIVAAGFALGLPDETLDQIFEVTP